MTQPEKNHRIFDLVCILVLSVAAILFLGNTGGFWEPWESSMLSLARSMAQHRIGDTGFWVPFVDGHFVYKPYIEIWSLMSVFWISPEPSEFMLRLPTGIAAVVTLFLTFIVVRRYEGRIAAWSSALVLLSLPFFWFGAKLVHANLAPLTSVAWPVLLYLFALKAENRRESHAIQSLLGLSFFYSFVSGGFLGIFLTLLLFFSMALIVRDKRAIRPFNSKFFVIPFMVAFASGTLLFEQYLSEVRYTLEMRERIDIVRVNQLLEKRSVEEIYNRRMEIIGTYKSEKDDFSRPFVITAEGNENITHYPIISSESPKEFNKFQHNLRRIFNLDGFPQKIAVIPPEDGAWEATLKFFFYDVFDNKIREENITARTRRDLAAGNPLLEVFESREDYLKRDSLKGVRTALQPGQRVIDLFESQDGISKISVYGKNYFIASEAIAKHTLLHHLQRQVRILVFGLFPWLALLPFIITSIIVTILRNKRSGENQHLMPILLIWFVIALIAQFIGLYSEINYYFIGSVPFAVICGIMIANRSYWAMSKRYPSLESLFSLSVLALFVPVFLNLLQSPLFFVEHLVREPRMKWPDSLELPFSVYFVSIYFILMILWAFFGIYRAIVSPKIHVPVVSVADDVSQSHSLSDSLRKKSVSGIGILFKNQFVAFYNNTEVRQKSLISLALVNFGVLAFSIQPGLNLYLSDRNLLDSYKQHAENFEKLYLLKYNSQIPCTGYDDCPTAFMCVANVCRVRSNNLYTLAGAAGISRDVLGMHLFKRERIFAIIPKLLYSEINQLHRSKLPSQHRYNLPILQEQSPGLMLISNRFSLDYDKNDESRINQKVLPPDAAPKLIVADTPVVDGLRFIGHKIQRRELTLCFRVNKTPAENWKIRISLKNKDGSTLYGGRSALVDPALPTQSWLPNDIMCHIARLPSALLPFRTLITELSFALFDNNTESKEIELGEYVIR